MASIRSRIHPKYKTKCRGADWAERDRSLVLRDDITFWLSPDAIAEWDATPFRRSSRPAFGRPWWEWPTC